MYLMIVREVQDWKHVSRNAPTEVVRRMSSWAVYRTTDRTSDSRTVLEQSPRRGEEKVFLCDGGLEGGTIHNDGGPLPGL
jgi:hypothetical protein